MGYMKATAGIQSEVNRLFLAASSNQGLLCNWDAIFANMLAESDPPELVDNRTTAEKALGTIELPDNLPPEKVKKFRRQQRRFRIVRYFLEAEDKEAVLAELSEKWGLTEFGIRIIVADGMRDGRLPADLAAVRNAVCFVKRQQIFEDGRKAREEIVSQITQAQNDDDWLAVERVEDDSEKGGVKTKHISKNTALLRLHSAMQDTHRKESDALPMYMEKPATKTDHSGTIKHQLEATQEFREQFKRIRQLETAEIRQNDTEPAK